MPQPINPQNAFALTGSYFDIFYVVDSKTYEIVYMNEGGHKLFGPPSFGCPCYKQLYQYDAPCPFCNGEVLCAGKTIQWQRKNPANGQYYLVKNQALEIEGRMLRIEAAIEITEVVGQQKKAEQSLRHSVDGVRLTIDCLRLLQKCTGKEAFRKALQQLLPMLADHLQAGSVTLVELQGTQRRKLLHWPETGRPPLSCFTLPARWRSFFLQRRCMTIGQTQALQDAAPSEYDLLKKQGMDSLCAAPILEEEQVWGYLLIGNLPIDRLRNAEAILTTVCYFIESTMQQVKTSTKLYRLSYYDALTGAYNRNAYARDIHLNNESPVSMVGAVSFDVNGISDLNNAYGHKKGDEILKWTVKQIQVLFPEAKVYRTGGDEFAALAYGIPHEMFKERLVALHSRFLVSGRLTVSIGESWEAMCSDLTRLAHIAENRMYLNKQNYYRTSAVHYRYRHSMDDVLGLGREGALEEALADGRFHVWLQPKVSLAPGAELVGAEALVRFFSPNGEIVPPDQFIPTLEESRYISKLDFYVFEFICKRIAYWLRTGVTPVPISVNFSRYTLSDENYIPHVEEVWRRYDIPKKYLKLEITESVEEDDNRIFLSTVRQLREKGFAVSIDDFGVRYANLALFSSCTFDELKIDKALISDLEQNPKAQAIISSVADICKKMGVELIVEGVETPSQARLLYALGCPCAQGFLYSRPLPLTQYEMKYCYQHP